MSEPTSIGPRPGVVTRAKNANQRPGKILTNGRRTRRSPAERDDDKKAVKVRKHTKTPPPKLNYADVVSAASTTAGTQVYDIVSIAQIIVAELVSSKRKVIARDSTSAIEVQSYACRSRSYYYLNSRPNLTRSLRCNKLQSTPFTEPRYTFIGAVPPAPPPCTSSLPLGLVIRDTDRDEYHIGREANDALEGERDDHTCTGSRSLVDIRRES